MPSLLKVDLVCQRIKAPRGYEYIFAAYVR